MKKLLLTIAAILMLGTVATNAQTKITELMIRGGFATNQFIGDDYDADGFGMNPGYNVGLELNNFFYKSVYWNTGLLFGSRGYKYEVELNKNNKTTTRFRAHNFQIPLTIGYRFDLGDGLALDGRIGGFFSTDLAANYKNTVEVMGEENTKKEKITDWDHYNRCDGGLLVGIGLWINNINLDFAYQRGFAERIDGMEGGASNFLIRLGYAF